MRDRGVAQLVRRDPGHYRALVHYQTGIRYGLNEGQVLLHQQDSQSLFVAQPSNNPGDVLDDIRLTKVGGLVEQDDSV